MGTRVPEHIVRNMKTQNKTNMFYECGDIYKTENVFYPLNCPYRSDYVSNYAVNVQHPLILPYFEAFLSFNKGKNFAPSDDERLLFESDMMLNVFKSEAEGILKRSNNHRNLLASYQTLPKFKKKYDDWVQYRTELFGEKREAV